MSDAFDPYHKWLGIPPRDQPPNYYRLLGLELFEDDAEVIRRAADRQMSYVRGLCHGPQAEAASQLLSELTEARRALLEAAKKRVYDSGLRDGQHVAETSYNVHRPVAVAAPVAPSSNEGVDATGKVQPPPVQTLSTPDRESDKSGQPAIALRPKAAATPRQSENPRWSAAKVAVSVCGLLLIVAAGTLVGRKPQEIEPADSVAAMPHAVTADQIHGEERASEEHAHPTRAETTSTAELNHDDSDQRQLAPLGQLASPVLASDSPEVSDTGETAISESFPYKGLVLWLDAADEQRREVDGHGGVAALHDGSRQRCDALQSDPAARPKLQPRGPNSAIMRFEGTHFLRIEDAPALKLDDQYTLIVAAQGETGVLLDKGDGYNSGAFSFWNGVRSFRTDNRMITGGKEASRLGVHSILADESSLRWYVDGALSQETSASHHIANDQPLLIGRRQRDDDPRFFSGELAELLLYNRALQDAERAVVERYLVGKWLREPEDLVSSESRADGVDAADAVVTTTKEEPSTELDESLPAPRGMISREVWLDVMGNDADDFMQHVIDHPKPDEQESITQLATPEDMGDNYGQRLRGYLHAPLTGEYEFSVRANAEGILWLSSDETPNNKQRIENGAKIALAGDHAYFLEAFHKESTGKDNFSIGWTLPDGTAEDPIPGERLSIELRIPPPHAEDFVVLKPLSAAASRAGPMRVADDGTVLAEDASNDLDTLTVTAELGMRRISGLRLEALPHASLPAGGPGRGIGGRCAIVELRATLNSPEDSVAAVPIRLAKALSSDGADLRRLIDGDAASSWRLPGRGDTSTVTILPERPLSVSPGARLRLQIATLEGLSCFRLLATSAADPLDLETDPANSGELFVLHVNCGGQDYTGSDGIRWRESRFFDNKTFGHEGGNSVVEEQVANPVQGSALRGIDAFRAAVPNGTYEVTLYFCEYWSSTPGSRVFAIGAEQRVVASRFDLQRASGGLAIPYRLPIRNVIVSDGRLDLEFRPAPSATTTLNAIEIKQVR